VRVETAAGPYIVAGDAVMCHENLAGDPAHHLPFIMLGRYMNLEEAWRSLERIRALDAPVLPGHENAVLARSRYP
jgi:glyoxylase-like metal-dependent hydrolase (beta-lactamase superfamily II)